MSVSNDILPVLNLSLLGNFVNGAASSTSVISLCHPLFTIKTRLMSGLTFFHSKQIYAGFRANLSCDISNQAVAFFAFNFFSTQIMRNNQLSTGENLLGGIFAGFTSAPLLGFLERIMILQQLTDTHVKPDSMGTTAKKIVDREGWNGFIRGAEATALRESVNASCFFCLSQIIQPIAEKHIESKNVACLIAYQISGAIGGCLSTPFDVIKTRMQNQLGDKSSFLTIIKKIPKKDLFKGVYARILAISSSMMLLGFFSKRIPLFFPEFLYHKEYKNESE